MLDHNSAIPLYYQLKEILKENIKESSLKEGQKVPSERNLMTTFKVSRATAKKALDELVHEGLIYRKQGLGTYVSKSKVIQNLIGEASFNQQILKQGLHPSSNVVYSNLENVVPNRIAKILYLDATRKAFKIIRVRLVNNEPLILESLFIPEEHAPNLLEQDLEKIAIFKYLEEECDLKFTHSTLDIEPIIMNEFESEKFNLQQGVSALALERIIYSNESALIIQKRIMRGDRGKFTVSFGQDNTKEKNSMLSFDVKSCHQKSKSFY